MGKVALVLVSTLWLSACGSSEVQDARASRPVSAHQVPMAPPAGGADDTASRDRPTMPTTNAMPATIRTTELRPSPVGARPAPVEASAPLRVELPSVGIHAALVELGLGADGAVEPPADFDTAGWYTGSVQPGQAGPAVVAGHVDSTSGPAAFYRLGEVAVGDEVIVHRDDGSAITFRVTGIEQYAKERVPTEAVYGPVPGPALRLITCGGAFDRSSGHYRDNIVVFASLA